MDREYWFSKKNKFQPTLPSREETQRCVQRNHRDKISTHSSLTGRDFCGLIRFLLGKRFQPTLPSREETREMETAVIIDRFQPTLPSREETILAGGNIAKGEISTHSSLTGRDVQSLLRQVPGNNFNPLFPRGKRRLICREVAGVDIFQPTLPSREETKTKGSRNGWKVISTHSSLAGRDRKYNRLL